MDEASFKILVSHSGKQHAYWHARALQNLGRLDRFVTSAYYKPDCFPDRWLGRIAPVHRLLQRRYHPDLDPSKVVRRWRFELPELVARRLGAGQESLDQKVFQRDRNFDRWVARHWAGRADVFWGFQGSCLESLKAARSAGRFAVLELATVHVPTAVRVLQTEAERHPEWANTISNYHFPGWYRARLEAEPHEANLCVVASPYTRESLLEAGIPDEKIVLLPLGAELDRFTPADRSFAEPRLRVLFAGGVGQRKGIKYLLEAVKQLGTEKVELRIAGPLGAAFDALHPYKGSFELLGRMDQQDLVQVMHECHVMVLPSVLEGFGLVIPEAMATGLPVISSTHSAAPEIIRDGVDGFVLEPDDVAGLADRLRRMAADRELCRRLSESAVNRAGEYSWERHQQRLGAIVSEIPARHSSRPTTTGSPQAPASPSSKRQQSPTT